MPIRKAIHFRQALQPAWPLNTWQTTCHTITHKRRCCRPSCPPTMQAPQPHPLVSRLIMIARKLHGVLSSEQSCGATRTSRTTCRAFHISRLAMKRPQTAPTQLQPLSLTSLTAKSDKGLGGPEAAVDVDLQQPPASSRQLRRRGDVLVSEILAFPGRP